MPDEIVVQDREELIYLLCEAAEFEHTVMCSYLYAQWTLKRDESEGVTPAELAAIDRWRRSLAQVAREEMLHLSLVNNLLAAIGAAPHLWRPAFPVRPGHFPADVVMNLAPFCEATLDHFMFIERPEGIPLVDGAGFGHAAHYERVMRRDLLSPSPQDYVSQGHLYHGALQGMARLVGQLGEERVFVGHGDAQVGVEEFPLPGLFRITDLASAQRAVEVIVLQGEGAPAHRENSHFARFDAIRRELAQLRALRPAFLPARPVVRNPILGDAGVTHDGARIVEPATAQVVDLGNAIYALMIRALSQVLAPAPLPADLRRELAEATTTLMSAMGRVADLATRLPLDSTRAGATAALNFELPRSSGQLVQQCAARILGERAAELAAAARRLTHAAPLTHVADELDGLASRLDGLHHRFETHLGAAVDRVAQLSVPTAEAGIAAEPEEALHAGRGDDADLDVVRTAGITLRFVGSRCIHSRHCVLEAPTVFLANTRGAWLHPETTSVEHCVRVAHNCPSGAITYERHDGGPSEAAPAVNVVRVRENGPYAVHARVELAGAGLRATLCRCGRSRGKPYCDGSHGAVRFTATGEPATQPSEPLAERGGPLAIMPVENGPLQLHGNVEICSGTGRTVLRTRSARLCRCGGSGNKPFCDGSHARIGFRSDD
ncbi:MAG: CDGSH iron-sulfur domain-containing protein [Betaproteobacteria bacterium]|nr:CDGSH iron-sulfur domain-containing protein [Betaproteobacteria bacterium]